MPEQFDVVVVGAGQAGLSTSYWLTQRNINHVVLEAKSVGESWRNGRWDSFTLVTPNFMTALPGFAHPGDPDEFLTREEVVEYLEAYATHFSAPLRCGVFVNEILPRIDGGFIVKTDNGTFEAPSVVVACGSFQRPKIPELANQLPNSVYQVHSSSYKNPQQLPDGGVLVVGSGQSGAQIAEELYESGREVYLAVSKATRVPRRYRGKDIYRWAGAVLEQTVDQLSSPAERFLANPHLSGKDGGHEINLHVLGQNGIVLLGRLQGVQGNRLTFAPDLLENLYLADEAAANLLNNIDAALAETEIQRRVEASVASGLWHGENPEIIAELDVEQTGIRSVVWATGYSFDFSWVKEAPLDDFGYPVQTRGVTPVPGLYFVGLQWLYKFKSLLLYGVGEDAAYVVDQIETRVNHKQR